MRDMTPRQSEIYCYLRDHLREHQRPPTLREIGKRFGFSSPNGVICHLAALEKKGLIRRDARAANAIQLVGVRVELVEVGT